MTELKKMDYDRTVDTAVASGNGAAESRHDLHLPLRAAEGHVLCSLERQ